MLDTPKILSQHGQVIIFQSSVVLSADQRHSQCHPKDSSVIDVDILSQLYLH